MYGPAIGRFPSQDPVLGSLSMPQTLNRYAYDGNNPLKYKDPTGEFIPPPRNRGRLPHRRGDWRRRGPLHDAESKRTW